MNTLKDKVIKNMTKKPNITKPDVRIEESWVTRFAKKFPITERATYWRSQSQRNAMFGFIRDELASQHQKSYEEGARLQALLDAKTLASQRQELIGEIKEWAIKEELPLPHCHKMHEDLVRGHNQALLKLRQFLNKLGK